MYWSGELRCASVWFGYVRFDKPVHGRVGSGMDGYGDLVNGSLRFGKERVERPAWKAVVCSGAVWPSRMGRVLLGWS